MAGRPNRRRRLLIGATATLGAAALGAGALLRAISPGAPPPLADGEGHRISAGISERVFVNINGIRQGMIVQSTNLSHPVLLFLHGGPGMPEFFLNTTHPAGLERLFTVVWWDQRGAGLSFGPDIPPSSMTVAQMIADTIAVTQYLKQRFAQNRVYLLGHSWGSFLGIQVAAAAPELFHAYIGMGQVTWQLKSEVSARNAMLDQYGDRGNAAMVRRLKAAPASLAEGLSPAWLRLRDEAMHGLGSGTTRDMRSVITGVFLAVWRCPAYTLREKVDIWRGLAFSRHHLWDAFLATDLTARIRKLDLPVYFFTGLHDLTANRGLSRSYFDRIEAPLKGFYSFANSAHSPLFEEPQRARDILQRDVLLKANRLADRLEAG